MGEAVLSHQGTVSSLRGPLEAVKGVGAVRGPWGNRQRLGVPSGSLGTFGRWGNQALAGACWGPWRGPLGAGGGTYWPTDGWQCLGGTVSGRDGLEASGLGQGWGRIAAIRANLGSRWGNGG